VKTYWREAPDEAVLKESGLEVVLPEAAELTQLSASLLIPTALPQLSTGSEISVQQVREYFAGGHLVKIAREGYEELLVIPQAERSLVDEAIQDAVREGRLWLTSGPSSVLGEEIPAGILSDQALLQAPPTPIAAADLLPENLADAWQDSATTALGVSNKAGKVLPWLTVRRAIDGALSGRLLERVEGQWPCEYASAQLVKLKVSAERSEVPPPLPPPPRPGVRVAEAELRPNEIQDLADAVGELIELAAGQELRFRLRVELGIESLADDVVEKIGNVLADISKDLTLK
jgi:hypothetical protein